MVRCIATCFVFILLAGCESQPKIPREEMFGPSKVRLHPTFTQVKDWNGDKRPDGVEVVVELLDSFGEPTRASGTLIFELFSYRQREPTRVNNRVAGPWKGLLLTKEQQTAHWSAALRAYTFQLAYPTIGSGATYTLTVTFETPGGADKADGGRLFDKIVIEPPPGKKHEEPGVKKAVGPRI